MQNVIATLSNLVCRQSQLNTLFRYFCATEVGGLEAQSFQGEPNSMPKLLSGHPQGKQISYRKGRRHVTLLSDGHKSSFF